MSSARTRPGHHLRLLAPLLMMLLWVSTVPAHAAVLGDCDDDDETGITELQQCVNIFLGDALELCPFCSTNCEDVGITDVQGTVNCFLDSTAESCPMSGDCAMPTPTPTIEQPPTETPTSTNTPRPTNTPTATLTPTPTPVCPNGLLQSGEECDACTTGELCSCAPASCIICAQDCAVSACTPVATPPRPFRVDYQPPSGQPVTAIKVRVGYRSNRASLPGVGPTPGARITNRPSNTTTIVNDLNYAVEVTMSRTAGLVAGRLFNVNFDGCQGGQVPTVDDLACAVLDCASSFGPVAGCTCSVTLP